MSGERPKIEIPEMCQKHKSLLVQQAGYSRTEPWRALIIMAQLALFQGAAADPVFWERVDNDPTKVDRIGCLACFKPDRFGEIVEAAKNKNDPGAIKRLGDSYGGGMVGFRRG